MCTYDAIMHSRREYSPHLKNERTDPINTNKSSTIKNSDNTTLNFRSAIETQPRENYFSPESTASPTYDYKSLPRSSHNEPHSPSTNVSRKMVTISRKDSPNHSSAFSRPQMWSHSTDVVYNTKNNHFTNNTVSSYPSNESQSLREPVYKTTMITQVKSPSEHGLNDGFHRKALDQQHYSKQQADQHFIKFSVKQPQQPLQYKLQQYMSEPENKQQTYFQNDSNKKPFFYSSQLPHQAPSHPSFHSSSHPSFHPSSQLSPNSEKQYIISSYKPHQNESSTERFSQPANQLRSSPHQPRQLDDYNNNIFNYPNSNTNNNTLLNNTPNAINNNKNIYANTNNNLHNNNNNYIYNNKLNSSNINNNNNLSTVSRAEAEVDELTNLLVENMRLSAQPDFYGMCVKCSGSIMGSTNGCLILNQTYHLTCFLCSSCACSLTKGPFFNKDGVSFCEECYMKSVESCCLCEGAIVDRLIKARGRSYHACCFKCITCDVSLDGSAFMVDVAGNLFCVSDFNKQHGIRCRGCREVIAAETGEMECINHLGDHFHMGCFKCQDCDIKLSSACKGNGCFSMNAAILCRKCHVTRLQKIATTASTEL